MSQIALFLVGVGIGFALFEVFARWHATKKTKQYIADLKNLSRDERMKWGGPY